MTSKPEQILQVLHARLGAVATCARNIALPERIPVGGLLVLRDGDPGAPDRVLGGFGGLYYSHEVELEVFVAVGEAAARDTAFDAVLLAIGAALDADPTLGGLAVGMTYARPPVDLEAIEGAPGIKFGLVPITIEYVTNAAFG